MDAASPEEAIAKAMDSLRQRTSQVAPPTRLRPICDALGIQVEYRSGDRHSGHLRLKPKGGYVASVTDVRGWAHRRFSLAHEIAHVILFEAALDFGIPVEDLFDPAGADAVERLCDVGAAALLAPSEYVEPILGDTLTATAIVQLAQVLGVSRAAAERVTLARWPELVLSTWRVAGGPPRATSWRPRDKRTTIRRIAAILEQMSELARRLHDGNDCCQDAVSVGEFEMTAARVDATETMAHSVQLPLDGLADSLEEASSTVLIALLPSGLQGTDSRKSVRKHAVQLSLRPSEDTRAE